MSKRDGGPAFPFRYLLYNHDYVHPGMSKREVYALHAMAGWLASYGPEQIHPANHKGCAAAVANGAFAIADAMIAEGERDE